MWYVISPSTGFVAAVSLTHAEAVRQAHHLATLRAQLVAGPVLRYKVRHS